MGIKHVVLFSSLSPAEQRARPWHIGPCGTRSHLLLPQSRSCATGKHPAPLQLLSSHRKERQVTFTKSRQSFLTLNITTHQPTAPREEVEPVTAA